MNESIQELYVQLGEAEGWSMPRIARYHTGPFKVSLLLQDPGSSFTAGSGAQRSGEIGVRNNDATARYVANALEQAGFEESEFLPLNALAGYDLRPRVDPIRRTAQINGRILEQSGVRTVIFGGRTAQRSRKYLHLSDTVEAIDIPHPSARGRGMATRRGLDADQIIRNAFRLARQRAT